MRSAFVLILLAGSLASAAGKAPPAKPVAAAKPAAPGGDVAAMKRALASTGGGARAVDPMKNDPNKALEVRGQSRTLSMMLVLKGGKESINFIKVRKDYREEILATPY